MVGLGTTAILIAVIELYYRPLNRRDNPLSRLYHQLLYYATPIYCARPPAIESRRHYIFLCKRRRHVPDLATWHVMMMINLNHGHDQARRCVYKAGMIKCDTTHAAHGVHGSPLGLLEVQQAACT